MATFLKEQRVPTLKYLGEKSTAYYKTNRDVFALGAQPELDIGAVANWRKDKNTVSVSLGSWKNGKDRDGDKSDFKKNPKSGHCRNSHSRMISVIKILKGKTG